MRGLKLELQDVLRSPCRVAPRRGAWIETYAAAAPITITLVSHPAGVRGLKHIIIEEAGEYHIESHPAGVRGLKRLGRPAANIDSLSHPAGVRGLKPLIYEIDEEEERVAPRRGAWIETSQSACLCRPVEVAPRRGAWIETL